MKKIMLSLSLVVFSLTDFSWAQERWVVTKGEESNLCLAVRDRLQAITVAGFEKFMGNSCVYSAAVTYPEFEEPPWKELSAVAHENLIYELLRFANLRTKIYFNRQKNNEVNAQSEKLNDRREKFNFRFRQEARDFIVSGGKILIWRTKLVSDFRLAGAGGFAPDQQNVIKLIYPAEFREDNKVACPKVVNVSYSKSLLFFVSDDLTGPDPRIGYTGDSLLGSIPMLWKGRPVFLAGGGNENLTVGWDEGFGPFDFCEIQNSK
jgi:hypothetical protein